MANPYPAQLTDDNNRLRVDGSVTFTDATNQPSPFTVTKRTLSSAEILALHTAPIAIVAAPGAGKMLYPVAICSVMNAGNAPYATNTEFQLLYGTGTNILVVDLFNFLDSATSKLSAEDLAVTLGGSLPNPSDCNNKAINATVATGNPTAGNGTVTLTVVTFVCDLA